MKPTNEQIKEFWEWVFGDKVGFGRTLDNKLCVYKRTHWIEADKEYNIEFLGYGIDTIDLNNLFKYAVPKVRYQTILKNIRDGWHCMLYNSQVEPPRIEAFNEDPALALFWAIKEVQLSNSIKNI